MGKKKERTLVSLPEGIDAILENELMGFVGDNKSEIIRNMVISYLSNKGYLDKNRWRGDSNAKKGE